ADRAGHQGLGRRDGQVRVHVDDRRGHRWSCRGRRRAWGIGHASGGPSTTSLLIVPMPSTVIVTTSPGFSGGGSRLSDRPVRPHASASEPPEQVPEAITSPALTQADRDAYATSSPNDQAMLASRSPPIRTELTST